MSVKSIVNIEYHSNGGHKVDGEIDLKIIELELHSIAGRVLEIV